jgi:flagellar biosynthetic protein FlhB
MAEDLGERTEPATERRRQEARKQGQVAHSRDLTAGVTLLAAIIGFQQFGEEMLAEAARMTRFCLQEPWLWLEPGRVRAEMSKLALLTFQAIAPWFLLVYATAMAVEFIQAGGIQVTERNFFDPNRLNPVTGLGRLFSTKSLVKTGFDLLKTLLVGGVAVMFLAGEMPAFASLAALGYTNAAGYMFERSIVLAYELVSVLIILGVADYFYQRYQFEQDIRMTRQEVKEEYKDVEGDPVIKQRRRQIQMRLARQRMIQQVPEAEVVITNPTHLAIALKYKVEEMSAPVMVAKGAGVFAQRIREIADENGIPIVENKPLARLLFFKCDVDRVIPDETFLAVAEILAYVYQLTHRKLPPKEEGAS